MMNLRGWQRENPPFYFFDYYRQCRVDRQEKVSGRLLAHRQN